MARGKHAFSIQMKSRDHIRQFSISRSSDGVLLEGELGDIEEIGLIEGVMLQIDGEHGILRIDLLRDEIQKLIVYPGRRLKACQMETPCCERKEGM